MLSELETYCLSVEDNWSYIPLYLLVENEKISLNHTTLNNIIVAIAKKISITKQLTLNEMLNAGQTNDARKYITENLDEDIYQIIESQGNYHASENMQCYNSDKNEFPRVYLETFEFYVYYR